MIKTGLLTCALAIATATSANAAAEAYLKTTGSGMVCTFVAPCNSIVAAIFAAGAGGEVICLDKGPYGTNGTVNITQSVTISCGDGLWELPHGQINITTPANAEVVIEGLTIDAETAGCCAITYSGQGTLRLRRVRSGNMTGANSHGLSFTPIGPATLDVSDSYFYFNGGSGIHIRPIGSGYANVHMRNVKFERNSNGLFIDGSASTVGVNVDVVGSAFTENSGNGIGAFTTTGNAGVTVTVKDAQISGNVGNGVGVLASAFSGAGSARVAIGNSVISGNVNGISASSSGRIDTYGNNQVLFNGNDGTFTGAVGFK